MSYISPQTEASAYHIPGGKYDRIDQWLGDTSVTTQGGISVPTEPVTVDPIGNSAWIHEGGSWRHQATKQRGEAYDRRDVRHMLGYVQDTTPPLSAQYKAFVPRSSDLGGDRFLSRASANLPTSRTERDQPCAPKGSKGGHRDMWDTGRQAELMAWRGVKGDTSNYGRMPAIRKMLDEGRLPDKSVEVINREMLDYQQRVSDRMNDRGGKPDYGLPC
jgi:hypothetical protein